jgi:ribose transport system permease protein
VGELLMIKKINIRRYAILIALIIVVLIFSIAAPNFRTFGNFITILRQISMLGIISVGMMFTLLTGNIDLSLGSQMSVIGVVTALLVVNFGMNIIVAMLIGLIVAILIGFFNGIVIAKTKMPSLIATLAMLTVLRGLAFILCGGLPVYGMPDSNKILAAGYVGPIPIPVIVMVFILALGSFLTNRTYIGRYFYAVGSNEEGARLSGINTDWIKITVFAISGFLAGIAGLIMLSRINSGQPTAGSGFELDALTACVVGGVSISGGEGKIYNVVIGILLIGVLSNGLVIIGVNEYYQMVIKGLVLLSAVAFDTISKSNRKDF